MRLRLAVPALLVCCLLAAGCSGHIAGPADFEPMSIEGWATFSGPGLSLQLPASFVGGDPHDPEVAARLKRLQLVWVEPDFWMTENVLELVGELDASGDRPCVTVYRTAVETMMPFKFYVMNVFDFAYDDNFRIEELTSDRAVLVGDWWSTGVRFSGAPATVYRVVCKGGASEDGGYYMYTVEYWYAAELAPEYDALFRTSGQTIVMEH